MVDLVWPILGLVVVAGIVWLMRLGALPHTVVRIADGGVRVVRGKVPPRLVHDLEEVARRAPEAKGRVELRGKGSKLDLRVQGLDGARQRIRNVVWLYRDRLG